MAQRNHAGAGVWRWTAGADATLAGLLIVVGLAGVIVLPALGYLLWLTQTEDWTRA